MHRSAESRHPHSNSHTLNFRHTSEIQLDKGRVLLQRLGYIAATFFSMVLIPLKFPISPYTRHPHSITHTQISAILDKISPPRSSWVRVVFCFRDSAKAQAPSAPI